jgi:hypothetical protein
MLPALPGATVGEGCKAQATAHVWLTNGALFLLGLGPVL